MFDGILSNFTTTLDDEMLDQAVVSQLSLAAAQEYPHILDRRATSTPFTPEQLSGFCAAA